MVHIVKTKSIHDYIDRNPNAGNALRAWLTFVRSANWEKPQDIVETFGAKAVDILPVWKSVACERAVIDIKGNHLRIIVKYQFHLKLQQTRIYIKWIGTHTEYDKLCDQNKQYDVEMFK